ncbi:archaeosine tRNA-ribosyltransferase [Methanocella conradii HZ254]|uniref:tRNA-guanine(15) transglycosylase n=1 Tax=Methanocella conradii (strain DSM 24694 / JCM 17849 / CGMCC 1.5162 / HZ254) TaxID=1041930 RepID=H8I615_METCZ|nr:tRNA guanosine(15) transglycosylase TgtA [Methanocella conradii]AFD00249.1 archaeosine tRNA-ribosyltransferase [Methanocella conradii HZ254]
MANIFEITDKDLLGRIGKLYTPHGVVETPTVMPVINPNLMLIEPGEMGRYGAQMLITNSYIIYKSERWHDAAVKQGLHSMLGFNGPIMTDSGAFQLSIYGSVEVTNEEIVSFQRDIGSDIGVPLDIPTPPDVSLERAKEELEVTFSRLSAARKHAGDMLLAGPVQGSTYPELREEAARKVYEIGFDVYPLGAVVPLMEAYRYRELVDVIARSKMGLGPDAPVHLFGAGHPMMLALAVALGCDLFDSAAYALYAKDGRYLTVDGTYHLGSLQHLPCDCPVCASHTAKELIEMDENARARLLAEHNLYVTFAELRLIKQSIIDGDLMELVERRCRSHPRLLSGLKRMMDYSAHIEKFDPATKSAFFYLGPESCRRPEVIRHNSLLDNLEVKGSVLITTDRHADSTGFDEVFYVKAPFGVYPEALSETYPIGQSETVDTLEAEARDATLQNIAHFIESHKDAAFTFAYTQEWECPLISDISKHAKTIKL